LTKNLFGVFGIFPNKQTNKSRFVVKNQGFNCSGKIALPDSRKVIFNVSALLQAP
jgi:hypothetical protein